MKYQLIKDGVTYEYLHDSLDDLIEENLAYSIVIMDCDEVKGCMLEESNDREVFIKIYTDMKARQSEVVYWLNADEYYIIPSYWTVEKAIDCLKTFNADSEYRIVTIG
ncbi:hypothetical protein [Veillonella sp. R32]|uniref:hypothetical protein n=1 Tax=Veillonella sp. R32 TaxID=2021312 RepID=UPI00138A066F|nr:hypothetical protein [Veillonella sp. R32]KAF1679107.1 hypothetical protein VER_09660 [Veillonella sp. R32]